MKIYRSFLFFLTKILLLEYIMLLIISPINACRNFREHNNRNRGRWNVPAARTQSAQPRTNQEPSMFGSILNGVGVIMNVVGTTIDTIGTAIKNLNNVTQPAVNNNNNGFNPSRPHQGQNGFNPINLRNRQNNGFIPVQPLPNIPSTNISRQTRSKSIWSKTKALCCLK
jgi:hypothetical protein